MGAPSTAPSQRIAPGVRIGSYLVEDLLGSGGMGDVYRARHVGLDKPVVLKTLHSQLATREQSVKRFVREGRAASKIRHPHVVDVTDVGTHEGQPYLVMEYLEGEDLHQRLDAVGRLTTPEVVRVILPVLDALAYAHEAGVIHRDLKPSNIFLAKSPHGETPMILDFGIAKLVDTETFDAQTITVAASYLGTPYYSSPEQAKSGRNATPASDQYSVGAIMYELLTGQHGLPGETPFEVLSAIVARQRASITLVGGSLDPAFGAIVDRAMAYEPADRFPSIRHLGHALLPFAPPDVAARWGAAFHVSEADEGQGVGFAETMMHGQSVEPSGPIPVTRLPDASGPHALSPVEPSGPSARPAFTPPGSIPGVGSMPPIQGPPGVGPSADTAPPRASQPMGTPVGLSPVATPTSAPPEKSGIGLTVVLAALAGLVVAAGVAGGVWYSQTQRGPSTVSVSLRASPDTATFEVDGEPVPGAGAVTVELPDDGREHRLSVRAEGHAPREDIRFYADSPPEPVTLEVLAEGPAEPPPEADLVPDVETTPDVEPDPPEDPAPETDALEDPARETDPPEDPDAPSRGSRQWWQREGAAAPTSRRGTIGTRAPSRRVAPLAPTARRGRIAPRRGTNNAPVIN